MGNAWAAAAMLEQHARIDEASGGVVENKGTGSAPPPPENLLLLHLIVTGIFICFCLSALSAQE